MKKTRLEKRLLNLLSMIETAKDERVKIYAVKHLDDLLSRLIK